MIYKNRKEAGEILAKELRGYRLDKGIVLAIPSGGIPIGRIIAEELDFQMEPFLSKKIGHPYNKEYAIGSVNLNGISLNENELGVSKEYIRIESESIRNVLKEKFKKFMKNRSPVNLKDRTVIIVDDGVATGNTLISAIQSVRNSMPSKLIVAVPVSAKSSAIKIRALVDDFVCPLVPSDFMSVGQYYAEFDQLTENDVMKELEKFEKSIVRNGAGKV